MLHAPQFLDLSAGQLTSPNLQNKTIMNKLKLFLFFVSIAVATVSHSQVCINKDDFVFFLYGSTINPEREAHLFKCQGKTGDIIIPDSVEYNSVNYPVTLMQKHAIINNDKIDRILFPNSDIIIEPEAILECHIGSVTIPTSCDLWPYSFKWCNLDTVRIQMQKWTTDEWSILECNIGNLFVETNETLELGWTMCMIDHCYIGDVTDVEIIFPPFGDYVTYYGVYTLKSLTMDAVTPPSITVAENYKNNYPNWEELNKLRWTVLFVPDESVELYKEAEFWKDFFSIQPQSEWDNRDRYIAEANSAFKVYWDSSIEAPLCDNESFRIDSDCLYLSGDRAFDVRVNAIDGTTLMSGTYADGDIVKLPKGIGILTVNGRSTKIVIR